MKNITKTIKEKAEAHPMIATGALWLSANASLVLLWKKFNEYDMNCISLFTQGLTSDYLNIFNHMKSSLNITNWAATYPDCYKAIRNAHHKVDQSWYYSYNLYDVGTYTNIALILGVITVTIGSVYLYKSLQNDEAQNKPLMSSRLNAFMTSTGLALAGVYGVKYIFDYSKNMQLFFINSISTDLIVYENFDQLIEIAKNNAAIALSYLEKSIKTPFSEEIKQSVADGVRNAMDFISSNASLKSTYCIVGVALASALLYRMLTAEKQANREDNNTISFDR